MTPENEDKAREAGGVATEAANAKLKHSDESGGSTTRDDKLDAGVPMLQGDASEPVGPEDAFGGGPKRGDYSQRTAGEHFEGVPAENAGAPIYADEDGKTYDKPGEGRSIVDYQPTSTLVSQTARASDQGEVKGKKGGVDTDDRAPATT